MGSNKDGRLGFSKEVLGYSKPQLIKLHTQIAQISCGWAHSFALDISNTVYAWGCNKTGALGNGNFNNCYKPREVFITEEKVCVIRCGARHSGFLTESGKVLMCGANNNGELGINSKEHRPIATPIRIHPIAQIALGVSHTLLLTQTGDVHAVGGNKLGQLGLGHKINIYTPQRIKELKNIKQIACGQHSAALSIGDEFYLWGTGTFGVYLTPKKMTYLSQPIIDIGIGGSFGVALDNKKNVWTWGTNTSGELGIGSFEAMDAPTKVDVVGKKIERIYCGSAFVIAIPEKISKRRCFTRLSSMSTYIKIPGKIVYKDFKVANTPIISSYITANTERKFTDQNFHQHNKDLDYLRSEIRAKDERISQIESEKLKLLNIIDHFREVNGKMSERNYVIDDYCIKDNKVLQKENLCKNIGDVDYERVIKEKDAEY